MMGPKRYRKTPFQVSDIPTLDAVFISHNHYDHLEEDAVKKIQSKFGDKVHWFVGMQSADW